MDSNLLPQMMMNPLSTVYHYTIFALLSFVISDYSTNLLQSEPHQICRNNAGYALHRRRMRAADPQMSATAAAFGSAPG